jgi:hypothetical protein
VLIVLKDYINGLFKPNTAEIVIWQFIRLVIKKEEGFAEFAD